MPVDVSGQFGMVRRIPESRYSEIRKSEEAQKRETENQSRDEIISLAAHIRKAWSAALNAKQSGNNIESALIKCLRQKKGEYSPRQLNEIRSIDGGSEVFMKLTGVKCRAGEAWIKDIMLPPGDRPWGIAPTPVPDLPEDEQVALYERVKEEIVTLMSADGYESVTDQQIEDRIKQIQKQLIQENYRRAKDDIRLLEDKIDDDLVEGSFYDALAAFLKDLVVFPAAFLKGPVIRRRKRLTWTEGPDGKPVPGVDITPKREYCRVSPFDIYPSPGAKSVQDGYLCERHRIRRNELQSMIGVTGFKESAIRAVLQEYGEGGLRQWLAIDQTRAEAEGRDDEYSDPEPMIDCVEFWGSCQGRKLREWGMSAKEVSDVDLDYQVNAWLIGNYIIMARLNPHPLGHRPYYSASFDPINDSIWGQSPPMLMEDTQNICNGTARALMNNMAVASGPQIELFLDRLMPGENAEAIHALKIWKTRSDMMGSGKPAVNFYQPNPMVDALIKVYDYFFKQASEETGIPAYVYGSEGIRGGASDTASGLSMLMNAASKTLKGVVVNIDNSVIKPVIREHWVNIMLYDEDVPKTGDINIVARASEHLIMAEQMQLRRTEAMERTNNPWDQRIIGDQGRAEILRNVFDSLKMDTDKIIPTEEEMAQRAQMEQQMMEEARASGIPDAAVVDAAGGAKGAEPGRLMQGGVRGL